MENRNGRSRRAVALVMCLKVWACTNGKEEEVILAGLEEAAEQGEVFLRAGHKMYHMEYVEILMDTGALTGYLSGEHAIKAVEIHHEPIPSKYQRADIYPGINIYDYECDVLKRGATIVQIIVAALVPSVLMLASAALAMKLTWKIFGSPLAAAVVGGVLPFILAGTILFPKATLDWCMKPGFWVAGISNHRKKIAA